MSTEIKAVQAVHSYDASKDKLVADLKMVVTDAEKLLKEAADSSADGFAALRTRVEGKLDEARVKLVRARAVVGESAQSAADSTQAFVKGNPWKSVGVLAAFSVIGGFLLGRRKPASDSDAAN
jgi:ElaB/YqjD/DUF883 family membrane-anchored ribosome-binding protein